MEGWIKLHRKLLNWEWYQDSNMVHLFIHILFSANYEAKKWKGIPVKRGELITGRKSLSKSTGISERSIRTCLNKLKSTNEIAIKSTNQYSIITVCKYDDYQIKGESVDQQNDHQEAIERPATDQQPTTTKNIKKDKKEKNIKNREELFHNSLTPFIPEFGNDMINEFFECWKEPTKSGKKMRFELQPTWSIKGRLAKWKKNQWGNKKKSETVEEQMTRLGL